MYVHVHLSLVQVSSTRQALQGEQGEDSNAASMTLEEEVMQRQREHEQKLAQQKEETDKMLAVSLGLQVLAAGTKIRSSN